MGDRKQPLAVPDLHKDGAASVSEGAASSTAAGWAHSGLRGWRQAMEDTVVAELIGPDIGCFAVFDGHGGDYCSRWAARELPRRLRAAHARGVLELEPGWVSRLLLEMDDELCIKGPTNRCGCTALVLLASRTSLCLANLGDSRAVMCRASQALPLSRDHKPRDSAEHARIVNAGGFVAGGRINGELALSRALGDFKFKSNSALPVGAQMVSAVPEVSVVERQRGDAFVVLACDGVWDVMRSADAVAFVAAFFERPVRTASNGGAAAVAPAEKKDAFALLAEKKAEAADRDALRDCIKRSCDALLDECFRRGSTDNITAVVVLLDPTLRPRPNTPVAPPPLSPGTHVHPAHAAAAGDAARGRAFISRLARLLLITVVLIACTAWRGQLFRLSTTLEDARDADRIVTPLPTAPRSVPLGVRRRAAGANATAAGGRAHRLLPRAGRRKWRAHSEF